MADVRNYLYQVGTGYIYVRSAVLAKRTDMREPSQAELDAWFPPETAPPEPQVKAPETHTDAPKLPPFSIPAKGAAKSFGGRRS